MKYSKEMIKRICAYIEVGMSQKDAAYLVGVSETQFYEWKKEKSEFSESLKKARLKREAYLLNIIRSAAKITWPAAAWLLQQLHKKKYKMRHELYGKVEHTLRRARKLSKGELDDSLKRIKAGKDRKGSD